LDQLPDALKDVYHVLDGRHGESPFPAEHSQPGAGGQAGGEGDRTNGSTRVGSYSSFHLC
jgi:hypothetical protein